MNLMAVHEFLLLSVVFVPAVQVAMQIVPMHGPWEVLPQQT